MAKITRAIVAVVVGLATPFILVAVLPTCCARVFNSASGALDVASKFLGDAVLGIPDDPFYLWLFSGVSIAVAIAAGLLVIVPQRTFRIRAAIYLIFLAVLLPASFVNWDFNDVLMSGRFQVVVNLIIAFLGATLAQPLATMPVASADTRVLKAMALIFLLGGGVLVPGFLSFAWITWKLHLMAAPPSWSVVGVVSGFISTGVGVLSYRRDTRKDHAIIRQTSTA